MCQNRNYEPPGFCRRITTRCWWHWKLLMYMPIKNTMPYFTSYSFKKGVYFHISTTLLDIWPFAMVTRGLGDSNYSEVFSNVYALMGYHPSIVYRCLFRISSALSTVPWSMIKYTHCTISSRDEHLALWLRWTVHVYVCQDFVVLFYMYCMLYTCFI